MCSVMCAPYCAAMRRSHAASRSLRWFCVVLVCMLQLATAAPFVTRSGNQLHKDGKPFYHVGFNAYWMPSSVAFNKADRVDAVLDGAQRMGLGALRVWAFNDAFLYAPGKYSEVQGRGLDYVIAAAGRRGIHVELALLNFWPAYIGPETWLSWAEGSTAGKNVAYFYRSEKVLKLLEDHIYTITGRINTFTGVAYKDDPTIMGCNLFNEPRCPGCTPEDMAARNTFIGALARTLEAAAPKQLTFSGTEGFFAADDPNVGWNPGHGSQCEGEDWTAEIKLVDVATTHMYWRQVEALRQTANIVNGRPGFDFYIQYLYKKLKLYSELVEQSGRPLLVEEFGLTKRFFSLEETKVVVAVVADALIAAKRAGKPLMAAWLWQAAAPGDPDYGGYDVSLTLPLSGATVGLGNTPVGPGRATPFVSKVNNGNNNNNAINALGPSNALLSNLTDVTALDSASPRATLKGTTPSPSSSTLNAANSFSTGPTSSTNSDRPVIGRRLLAETGPVVVNTADDSLDDFRRGRERAGCAARVVNDWQEQQTPQEVDVQRYREMVAPHNIVDILAEAARLLSE